MRKTTVLKYFTKLQIYRDKNQTTEIPIFQTTPYKVFYNQYATQVQNNRLHHCYDLYKHLWSKIIVKLTMIPHYKHISSNVSVDGVRMINSR